VELPPEELLKMKELIEESTDYKDLSDVAKEYQPYIKTFSALILSNLRKFVMFDKILYICLSYISLSPLFIYRFRKEISRVI
jgi:hypothetical protein